MTYSQRWRQQARCRGMDTETFFPLSLASTEAQRAFATCAACPVRFVCLADALAVRDVHGIRGGTTGDQRAAALRDRAA